MFVQYEHPWFMGRFGHSATHFSLESSGVGGKIEIHGDIVDDMQTCSA